MLSGLTKRKRKKYSLNERLNYYYNISRKEWQKYDKTGKVSNKLQFANGYMQGAERGRSLDYDKLNRFEKLGQDAGVKARQKSEKLKF